MSAPSAGFGSTLPTRAETSGEHRPALPMWAFDGSPTLVYGEADRLTAVDADEADLSTLRPRSRALLRALLVHSLERLDELDRR